MRKLLTGYVVKFNRRHQRYGHLFGRSRRGAVVNGRKVFCQVAVRKLEYTGAAVARFWGMTTSSINRMARLEEMPEPEEWDNISE